MSDYICLIGSIGASVVSWLATWHVTSRSKTKDRLREQLESIKRDVDSLAKSGSLYWTPTQSHEDRVELVIEIRLKYDSLSDKIDELKKIANKDKRNIQDAVNSLYDSITGGNYQSSTFQPDNGRVRNIRSRRSVLNSALNSIL